MPISAGQSLLEAQIKTALMSGQGANANTTAQLISSAIASVVPMGFFPTAPVPVPLSPSGLSAGQSIISTALNMQKGATVDSTSQMMANGISMIAPTAPPAGLSTLQSLIKTALSAGSGADPSAFASQLASAVVSYYSMGGVG